SASDAITPAPPRRSASVARRSGASSRSTGSSADASSVRARWSTLCTHLDFGRTRTMKKLLTPVLAVSMLGLALTGCGTATGAAVGAGSGAAIGAGTGYGAGKGALIGAGVGAAAGAIYDITKK